MMNRAGERALSDRNVQTRFKHGRGLPSWVQCGEMQKDGLPTVYSVGFCSIDFESTADNLLSRGGIGERSP